VDAPLGTLARTVFPEAVAITSTVGLPRLSKISLALKLLIFVVILVSNKVTFVFKYYSIFIAKNILNPLNKPFYYNNH
jgi:glucan phosphoethanolaminetransferase (alkaline phosphatase superfamily)